MTERVLFDVGWDYAAHGLAAVADAPLSFRDGYREGKAHFRKVLMADRYVRKWLQLRYNAAVRHRVFDEDVTPEFIALIDSPVCPVTRCALTHGTLNSSDWSVDRIINSGGYTGSNLMIMSTRANRAKGSLSLGDLATRINGETLDDALSVVEWRRLYYIVQTAHAVAGLISQDEYQPMPLLHACTYHIGCLWDQHLQMQLLLHATGRALPVPRRSRSAQHCYAAAKKSCRTVKAEHLLHKLVRRLEKKAYLVNPVVDIWWEERTFGIFRELYHHQVHETGEWPLPIASEFSDDLQVTTADKFRQDMSLQTQGFL